MLKNNRIGYQIDPSSEANILKKDYRVAEKKGSIGTGMICPTKYFVGEANSDLFQQWELGKQTRGDRYLIRPRLFLDLRRYSRPGGHVFSTYKFERVQSVKSYAQHVS